MHGMDRGRRRVTWARLHGRTVCWLGSGSIPVPQANWPHPVILSPLTFFHPVPTHRLPVIPAPCTVAKFLSSPRQSYLNPRAGRQPAASTTRADLPLSAKRSYSTTTADACCLQLSSATGLPVTPPVTGPRCIMKPYNYTRRLPRWESPFGLDCSWVTHTRRLDSALPRTRLACTQSTVGVDRLDLAHSLEPGQIRPGTGELVDDDTLSSSVHGRLAGRQSSVFFASALCVGINGRRVQAVVDGALWPRSERSQSIPIKVCHVTSS